MEIVSLSIEKQLLILKEKNKNQKYLVTEIFSENGYIFLLCHKYFLNIFMSKRSYSAQCEILLKMYLYSYVHNRKIKYEFEIEKISKLLCYHIETQQFCNNKEILDSLRLINTLTGGVTPPRPNATRTVKI